MSEAIILQMSQPLPYHLGGGRRTLAYCQLFEFVCQGLTCRLKKSLKRLKLLFVTSN